MLNESVRMDLASLYVATINREAKDMTNKHNPIRMEKAMYVEREKYLLVKASAAPLTDTNYKFGRYQIFLQFEKVKVRDTRTRTHQNKVKTKSGTVRYMQKLQQTNQAVRVRCDCKKFKFYYAYYDTRRKALYGVRFPPYYRKTPIGVMPVVSQGPGLCKHILGTLKILRRRGVLK